MPIPSIVEKINHHGQSIWVDNLSRKALTDGSISRLIASGVTGLTSNPVIFKNAIAGSSDYDSLIADLKSLSLNKEKLLDKLMMADVKEAAQLFRPVYEESKGHDGFVSIEVSPTLAQDADGTIQAARHFFEEIGETNIMIKIPATKACLPAIRQVIAEGIPVNVTLIFSLERYKEVLNAFAEGCKERGQETVSVASFFVSRLDAKVESKVKELPQKLFGKIALANCVLAYHLYEEALKDNSSLNLQRPLWASVGVKNNKLPQLLYVENLVARNSVSTVPPATLDILLDSNTVLLPFGTKVDFVSGAREILDETGRALSDVGSSLDDVFLDLENEGLMQFEEAYISLLAALQSKYL